MTDNDKQDSGSARRVRTLVAERDQHRRTVLVWLLSEDPRFEVVGSVGSGDEAAAWTGPLDAALVDLTLPGLDALQAVRALREGHLGITVVVLANVDVPYLRAAAASAGAAGYANRTALEPVLTDLLADLHADPSTHS